MELQTISQVSKLFHISTRTLRYYEQIGLIAPTKDEGYACRTYDADTIAKLRQIIVLRKLRIPLKQIRELMESNSAEKAIAEFECTLSQVESEITALSTIRSVIKAFIDKLNLGSEKLDLLDDENLLDIVDSLSASKTSSKEENSMTDLNQANEELNRLTDKNVRITYLPPATVAAIHCMGSAAETESGDLLFAFIKDSCLPQLKPDFRHYGFNHPNGALADGSDHGFERWVTIPDDMEVPPPFVKKQFAGGLYGAYMIPMGAFEEWNQLFAWANNHETYEIAWGDPECMSGLMEEHLNPISHYLWSHEECDQRLQLDLLIPIREKTAGSDMK